MGSDLLSGVRHYRVRRGKQTDGDKTTVFIEPGSKYHATYFKLYVFMGHPYEHFLTKLKGWCLFEGKVHSPAASLHLAHREALLYLRIQIFKGEAVNSKGKIRQP